MAVAFATKEHAHDPDDDYGKPEAGFQPANRENSALTVAETPPWAAAIWPMESVSSR